MSLQMSSSQTIGPYLHIGTDWLIITEMAGPDVPGERISIEGRVYDGNGAPVTDALVELWQADATGQFRFSTIMPGPGDAMQAPHIAVTVFARGLLKHLVTRIYFPDGAGHAGDAPLNAVPVERRATLIAQPLSSDRPGGYQFDIVLQEGPSGRPETLFLDV